MKINRLLLVITTSMLITHAYANASSSVTESYESLLDSCITLADSASDDLEEFNACKQDVDACLLESLQVAENNRVMNINESFAEVISMCIEGEL